MPCELSLARARRRPDAEGKGEEGEKEQLGREMAAGVGGAGGRERWLGLSPQPCAFADLSLWKQHVSVRPTHHPPPPPHFNFQISSGPFCSPRKVRLRSGRGGGMAAPAALRRRAAVACCSLR